MQVCIFETMNLSIPMIDINGVLYTSSTVLCDAFGIAASSLRSVMQRNHDRFSGRTVGDLLSVSDCDAKELQSTLKIQRLRKDTVLWSHRDLIHAGLLLTGETARAFQEDVIDLIERQARKNYVPRESLENAIKENTKLCELIGRLTSTLDDHTERLAALEAQKAEMASCVGRALSLVKG